MTSLIIKIDKGKSRTFREVMNILQLFSNVQEYKKHYTVRISEEEIFHFKEELQIIVSLLPSLNEKEWFSIPDYGTDEWANWMIDLHVKKGHI